MAELPNVLCKIRIIDEASGKTVPNGGTLAMPAKAIVRYVVINDSDKPAGPLTVVGALYRNDVKVQPAGQPNVVPAQPITLQPGQLWKQDVPLSEDGPGGSSVSYRATLLGDVGNLVKEGDEDDNLVKTSFHFQKPDPCEPIQQQIAKLRKQIADIHSSPGYIQGPTDPHPGKPEPELLAEVAALHAKLHQKNLQYDACKLSNGGKPSLSATFEGTATLTTTSGHAKGPFNKKTTIGLVFHKYDHKTFGITSFPAIVVGPFDVPGGTNTTTVTLTTSADPVCDPSTGRLSLSVTLHFDHSHPFAGDNDITMVLSTEAGSLGASRLDADGDITLAGEGTFKGGFPLGGEKGRLVLKGKISPQP